MRFLRTNTATRVTVGPFFDKTDGITPETALTVTGIKLTFMVDTGGVPTLVLDTSPTASGGANDMVHVTGDDAGFYDLELAAADVNYLGRAMLALTDAANHCPVFHEFMIIPAMIYDSMFLGTDRLDTNVTHIGDTAQTPRDIGASVLLSAGTGTGQLSFTSGILKVDVDTIKTNPVVNAGTVTFPTGATLASTTNITAGTITTVTNLTNAPTSGDFTATMKTSIGTAVAASAVASVTGNVGGNVTGSVGSVATGGISSASFAAGAINAAAIAADAITDAKVASDVTIASVTGAVGSVTGNVGGNVTGSVGSIASGGIASSSFAAGAINAAAIAADAIGASELAADAVSEIAGAVWDITLSSHLTGGTTGAALNAAGSAGDPWSTSLPGAYSAGSAGYIIGTNVNATISSRLASSSYTAPLDAAGTRSALGLATNNLDTQIDAIPTANENADALLKRDWTAVTGEAARSVLNALRFLRNKWSISGGTLSVFKENDVDAAWTATTTQTAGDPTSQIDPT